MMSRHGCIVSDGLSGAMQCEMKWQEADMEVGDVVEEKGVDGRMEGKFLQVF